MYIPKYPTKTILRLPLKYNYRTQLDIKFHRIHTNERYIYLIFA